MKVYFSCFTLYQLFVAVIVALTHYKNETRVLILSDAANLSEALIARLKAVHIWDEVIVIHESGMSIDVVEKQVAPIKLPAGSILHFFSFGILSSRLLVQFLDDTVKIILTEEGKMTYKPLSEFSRWRKCLEERGSGLPEKYRGFDWERIDEILVFEPKLFDGSLARPVKEIHLSDLLSNSEELKKLMDTLNYIFDYTWQEDDYEIVYFDTYLSSLGILSFDSDKFLLNKTIEAFKEYKFLIKTHPGQQAGLTSIRFEGLDDRFFIEKAVPWEVMYLNHIMHHGDDKLVLVTPFSTAVHNAFLLGKHFGINNTAIILLTDLIKDYLSVDLFQEDAGYINRFVQVYGNDRVFIPHSFAELRHLLKAILKGRIASEADELCYQMHELNQEVAWLKKQYVDSYRYLPDYINKSIITIDYGPEYKPDTVYQWMDTHHEDFKVDFVLSEVRKVERIKWNPYSGRVLGRVKIGDVELIDQNRQKFHLNPHHVKTNGIPGANGYTYFEIPEAFYEFNVGQEISGISITGRVFFEDHKLLRESYRFQKKNDNYHRVNSYYKLLTKWLRLKQQGMSLADELLKRGYQKVAIYGTGELGLNLLDELRFSPVAVVCFVKKNAAQDEMVHHSEISLKVVDVSDFTEFNRTAGIDAVIVSPVYDFEAIRNSLMTHDAQCAIISLEELVYSSVDNCKGKRE